MVTQTFERIFSAARYLAARDGEVLVSVLSQTLGLTVERVVATCETEGASLVALRFVQEGVALIVREN